MSYKIIKGNHGYCTVFYDTTIYNAIYNNFRRSSSWYSNGQITTDGQTILSLFNSYRTKTPFTFLDNLAYGNISADAPFSIFGLFFPILTKAEVRFDIETSELFNDSVTNRWIKYKLGSYKLIQNLNLSSDNASWSYDFLLPYGSMWLISTSGGNVTQLTIDLLIADDNGDNALNFNIVVKSNNSIISFAYIIQNTPRQQINTWIEGLPNVIPSNDPYNEGGNTEPSPDPPEGDFDNTSDPIDIPLLPTLSAVDSRFITLYAPSLAELRGLASYMWSDLFSVDTLKKLFADPMQTILGVTIVPVIPDKESTPSNIYIGNIQSNISAFKVSNQYKTVDCGILNLHEYWGSYLDYDPYTKLEIYLPYIGTQTIAVDDVMGKAIHVVYNIDLLSGACVAFLKSDSSVLYTFTGQCATQIPITSNDWASTINGVLSFTASAIKTGVAIASGEAISSVTGAISTASNVSQMKPRIQRSGSIGGSAGLMSVQKPYFILTRPRQALPTDQNRYTGYPSFITSKLGDLSGMTYVYEIHLEGIPCTTEEQTEIENLLKSGVIL